MLLHASVISRAIILIAFLHSGTTTSSKTLIISPATICLTCSLISRSGSPQTSPQDLQLLVFWNLISKSGALSCGDSEFDWSWIVCSGDGDGLRRRTGGEIGGLEGGEGVGGGDGGLRNGREKIWIRDEQRKKKVNRFGDFGVQNQSKFNGFHEPKMILYYL